VSSQSRSAWLSSSAPQLTLHTAADRHETHSHSRTPRHRSSGARRTPRLRSLPGRMRGARRCLLQRGWIHFWNDSCRRSHARCDSGVQQRVWVMQRDLRRRRTHCTDSLRFQTRYVRYSIIMIVDRIELTSDWSPASTRLGSGSSVVPIVFRSLLSDSSSPTPYLPLPVIPTSPSLSMVSPTSPTQPVAWFCTTSPRSSVVVPSFVIRPHL
jgi:hypothetical protein